MINHTERSPSTNARIVAHIMLTVRINVGWGSVCSSRSPQAGQGKPLPPSLLIAEGSLAAPQPGQVIAYRDICLTTCYPKAISYGAYRFTNQNPGVSGGGADRP